MSNFIDIPGRVFLDTSFVNFLFDYGEQIFDGVDVPNNISPRIITDVVACRNIFLLGQRANWQLAISPITYSEIIATKDAFQRKDLGNWFFEIWEHWQKHIELDDALPTFKDAEKMRVYWLSSEVFRIIPDINDRILIVDAITYQCDAFCTRDWKRILTYRDGLQKVPLKIFTPSEWWQEIQPYAQLF